MRRDIRFGCRFSRGPFFASTVLLCMGAMSPSRGEEVVAMKAQRPNIVTIIADDMGWADVGYHGSEIETPNLDQLAREGISFGHHYVCPTCTPTRVGLFTGRYPSRFGVTAPAYGKIFDDDTVTLASALASVGYNTAISGKWHMGSPPDCVPLKYGFQSSYGYFHGQIDPYTHLYKTGERCWHRNDQLLDEEGHATDLITNEAVRFVENQGESPFFLYVAYSVPHHPLDEPEKWVSMYEGSIKNESRRLFAASISHMDEGIGRILDALDRKGLRKSTMVVFSSDNGGQKDWSSKDQYEGRYADKPNDVLGNNLPLRGWKGEVYEGGIRVPALVNWPGVLEPGKVENPVCVVDWMPTLCGLAGYTPERDLGWDGRDIWPPIRGEEQSDESRTFYWKTPRAKAVRQGDWKLIVGEETPKAELFDISGDPCERNEVSQRYPDRAEELKGLLREMSGKDRERRKTGD